MAGYPPPLDLSRLRVQPLAERRSLSRLEDILVDPDSDPSPLLPDQAATLRRCADAIRQARSRGATVMLIYGAHLLRNGAARLLGDMMQQGFLTHLATNGAGTIHDWEFAWLGRSTESVRDNVASGTFGTWDETGRFLHLALLAGGVRGEGYGQALGRFIEEDGVDLPDPDALIGALTRDPAHPLAPARAELLGSMKRLGLAPGRVQVDHAWKHGSIVGNAFRLKVPFTVHPGIGYDIIANHPWFNGAVIGRAADLDFRLFGGAVQGLDGGVVLSVGSAIMGPQVFEKSLSCVNNLRLQSGCNTVRDHSFFVVDLQEGGGWDWTQGEPPKDNPAYYLRFCKSYSRMGGSLHYYRGDNLAFIHNLHRVLSEA